MAFWAKSVDVGSIETFKLPAGFAVHITQATLSMPSVEKPVAVMLSTTNFDGSSCTVAIAHLSKKIPQAQVNITVTDDKVYLSAVSEGEDLPSATVDLVGFLDVISEAEAEAGLGDSEDSEDSEDEGVASALAWAQGAASDTSDSGSDSSSGSDSGSDSDSEDGLQQIILAPAAGSGSDSGSDSDSDSGDEGAVELVYAGEDAEGNVQLVSPGGALFTVAEGADAEGQANGEMYLVEADAEGSDSGSDSDSASDSDEEGVLAIPHGPIVVETPTRGRKRRLSGASATPRSGKRRH